MSFFKSKPQGEIEITLGPIQNHFFKSETLTEREMNHHVHVVGASGYGKSVFLLKAVKALMLANRGFLYLDLKADLETRIEISDYAHLAKRESSVQLFSISNPSISTTYNPLSSGSATQFRDRIMTSFNWSEEFYKNEAGSFLLKILLVLVYLRDHKSGRLDFFELYKTLTEYEFIYELTQQIPNEEVRLKDFAISCFEYIKDRSTYSNLQGLRSQIENLIFSDFGELLRENENGINFFKSIQNKKVLLLMLDSRSYPESSVALGRFILQDLKATSAKVDAEIEKALRLQFNVIIDEFSDFAQDDFVSFLDRARSSRMPIMIAHQELCDLKRISPHFEGRLMGNIAVMYVFLQKRPESAEIIAKTAGTKISIKKTEATEKFLFFDIPTGKKSTREVEEFIIHPNEIKSLKVGECIAIKKYPYSRAHKVRIQI